MCTVQSIKDAIRENCQSQYDMESTDIDRVLQTLPFSQEPGPFSKPKSQRPLYVLVVCGHGIDETVKNDIATAERLRITATTLDGILTVKGQGRGKGGARHA